MSRDQRVPANPHAIDDEKLDFIESQPPSGEDEDIVEEPSYSRRQQHEQQQYSEKQSQDNKAPSIRSQTSDDSAQSYHGRFPYYHQHKAQFQHLIAFAVCTGLFIPAAVIRKEGNILVLSLLYAAIVWWLIVRNLPKDTIAGPISRVWNAGAGLIGRLPPLMVKILGYGLPPLALLLTAALRPGDANGTRGQRLISCLGLVVLLLITVSCSRVSLTTESVVVG